MLLGTCLNFIVAVDNFSKHPKQIEINRKLPKHAFQNKWMPRKTCLGDFLLVRIYLRSFHKLKVRPIVCPITLVKTPDIQLHFKPQLDVRNADVK